MGNSINLKLIVITGIIFILVLTFIFGWLYVKSEINSLSTSIRLHDIADELDSYIQKNSTLPPNLEDIGYKVNGNINLEYYREPKNINGLKVIALTNKLTSFFNQKRYGLILDEGSVYVQDIAPFMKPLSRYTEPIVIRELIQNAIPEAGPYLLEWLDYEINKSKDKRDKSHIEWIVKGIGLYRLKEGIEAIKNIYINNPTYSTVVLEAMVKINDPSQVNFLLECLKAKSVRRSVRCEIAGYLIAHGEDEGRKFLLKEYEVYLNDISTKSSVDASPREVLMRIYEAKLIEDIKELLNKDYIGNTRNNITTLITRMEINAWDIEKLLDMIQEKDTSKTAYKRYPAIHCLGEKAGLDVIPILNNITHNGAARNAVKEIKYRHWRDLIQN